MLTARQLVEAATRQRKVDPDLLWQYAHARDGNLAAVKAALAAGADVHARNDYALRNAAYKGHTAVVQLLLQHGAAVHADDDAALRYAAAYGHLPVVQLLLQHGADLSKLTRNQLQKLNLSNQELKAAAKKAFEGVTLTARQLVKAASVDPDLLWQYASAGDLAAVKAALAAGADVHAHDDTALRAAAADGHLPVVRLLLQHGAAVHAFDDAALRYAAYYGHTAVVQLLLQHGADLSKLTREQLQNLNLSNQDLKDIAKKALSV